MHLFAYLLLVAALLFALFFAGTAAIQIWQGRTTALAWMERAHLMLTAFMTVASAVLIQALVYNDFSLVYVASYTDRTLPLFYRLTAFWAGQAGSMLFWAWSVGIFGVLFLISSTYGKVSKETKLWFWMLFLTIMAFFLLILTCWSNPFTVVEPAPMDGNGLNPLLQHPGMIIHPPLLFLGYGGFAIPGCLAMAQALSGMRSVEGPWVDAVRPFTIISWMLLTAGIVLGAWWAYMELGWGGYWAWDPVENASLIPWLVATAYLHTAVIESRRNKLHRTNTFLMALTTISAFFATYLVRSGVVDSLHAFGSGGVGSPLLTFVLIFLVLAAMASVAWKNSNAQELEGLESREGFLVLTAWVFIALSLIILVATLWPVISQFWVDKPMGLEPAFYNRVCLPLFALLAVMLAICPWLGWKGGLRSRLGVLIVLVSFAVMAFGMWMTGYTIPLAVIGAAGAGAALVGIVTLFILEPSLRRNNISISAYAVHVGVLFMVIGVAFSGPFKSEDEVLLRQGQAVNVGGYDVQFLALYEGQTPNYVFIEAELAVMKDGELVGKTSPQRRIYSNFDDRAYSEAATIFSLGNEFYATLLGVDANGRATLRLNVTPLVNWIWIGSIIMSIVPIIALRRRKKAA
ncbi:MAG: cytochrome c-type biogenesis CcmF C-terminal domain-containing protein [Pseudomonadota bacterium]